MNNHATIDNRNLDKHLKYAEQIASSRNARLTPIRRHIYKCFIRSNTPLGAYEILEMLDGVGSSKPPTVYRALDWLIEVGLARKIESVAKYIAQTSSEQAGELALLLCETCGHAEHFDAGPTLKSIGAFAKSRGFERNQIVIEIIGHCAEHTTQS